MRLVFLVALSLAITFSLAVPISTLPPSPGPIDHLIAYALANSKGNARGNSNSAVCPKNSTQPPPLSAFPCAPYPHTPAHSIHELTPYDVGVIAAMGDSITGCPHCYTYATNTDFLFNPYRPLPLPTSRFRRLRSLPRGNRGGMPRRLMEHR